MSTQESKTDEPRSSFWKGQLSGIIVNLVLAIAIALSVLWLPPISLTKRLAEGGYTVLGEGILSVADPDGTQFTVLPEGLAGSLKARLTSIPRLDFLDGTAGEDLLPAAESVPTFLEVKSPLYRLTLKGEQPTAALLTIPVPNDIEKAEWLDVYAWTGSGWSWVSSEVFNSEELIIAELHNIPEQFDFVVAETRALPPIVSADLAGAMVPEEANGVVGELNPRALTLGDNGEVLGDVTLDASTAASFMIVPILSNVNADGTIRNDLVDNILVDAALRQTHIDNILRALEESGYHGVEIDYRAINPGLRDPFSDFIASLAESLHQQGRILTVRVELPRQVSHDQWDTGVYDWSRLGQVVDGIKVPSIADPQAFVQDGRMDQLIRWAISQVSRQQVQFILSTRSVDLRGSNPTYLPYADAMAPFTKVATQSKRAMFKAEERVVLGLGAGENSTNVMYDEGAHTHWFRYQDERNEEHTVWLENAASIAHKLRTLAQYNLRGAAFEYLLDDGNDDQIWEVVREYHSLTIPDKEDMFTVVWTVKDWSGKEIDRLTTPLSDPRLVWVAPEAEGKYTITAALSSDNGQTVTVQGQTVVQVGGSVPQTPTATPTPTPEDSGEKEAEATPTPTPEPTPTPTKEVEISETEAEAVVSNSLLNLRSGPGTNYDRVGQVRQGTKLKVLGKNAEGTWIKIETPGGTEAWVILTYVDINVSLDSVAVAQAPAAPTPGPKPTSAAPPPAPAPSGTGFGYGVQAHKDTARVVKALNDIGFGWVKQQVRWHEVEGSKGNYGFAGLDDLANTANAGGIKVLFSVVAAPGWSRGGKSGIGPPDNYQDFYDFMGAMAAHFRGRVHAYEIWNEQNLKREWEGAPLSAADYVRLLKGAYQAIKAADPGAIVVSGAPTPTGINDGSWAIDDRTYLQQMYNAGLKYYCDAVGAHPSGYANPPDVRYNGGDFDPSRGYDDHPSFFFRNTMEDYYNIMAANGDGAKRIWATEFGWPTTDGMGVSANPGYEFANDISESQQADYIVRAYTWSRNWGHAGVMFLWNLNFWPVTGAENEMAKYGIVRGDWSPRPAYIALKNLPK
jgi:spore germination protein YaaH